MLLSKIALFSLALVGGLAQNTNDTLPPLPLPAGINSSYVDCSNSSGLIFHILSSGYDPEHQKPLIVLLHGAPELAFTWRHIMAPLAEQGYFVVAPDQRGYGRTKGATFISLGTSETLTDPSSYCFQVGTPGHTIPSILRPVASRDFTNLVRDIVSLVYTLGYTEVHALISHDFGTVPGSYAPLLRPDLFKSTIQVSIPFVFVNPPTTEPATVSPPATYLTDTPAFAEFEAELQALNPPRQHYQWYNSQRTAAYDWVTGNSLGLSDFLRKYFFIKSYQWPGNQVIQPAAAFTGQDFEQFPYYQIMLLHETMPENVETMLNGTSPAPSEAWLSDADLAVFVSEFQRTGFQGDLNWYRVVTSTQMARDNLLLSGAKNSVPTAFIYGANDWSTFLEPGAVANYNNSCTDFRGTTVIQNSGHWVQEEQPQALLEAILKFLSGL